MVWGGHSCPPPLTSLLYFTAHSLLTTQERSDSQIKIQQRRTRVSAPHQVAKFFPLFLSFPQGSPVLHSFCTSGHQFTVARDSVFAHSAHSANVRCIEPAHDCDRAGGDRRFSRVNHREGFQKCASARFRKLGRCGLLRESFPKKQDWRRPLPQSLRVNVRESSIRGLIACGCASKRAFLRERGFLSSHFAA
jgi:hypothetical protein